MFKSLQESNEISFKTSLLSIIVTGAIFYQVAQKSLGVQRDRQQVYKSIFQCGDIFYHGDQEPLGVQRFLLQHRFFPLRLNLLLRHGTIFYRVVGTAVCSGLKTINFFVKCKFKRPLFIFQNSDCSCLCVGVFINFLKQNMD